MATIPSVQLFRNSRIITGRTAAAAALENQKSFVADGGLILARYSEDGTENGVKTLLGIVRNGGGTNAQLTIIDVEGAAENVQSAITSAINSLNKGDAEVEGQYVTSVSETKGIITVTRKDLPSLNKTSDSGKAITAITQTKGLVSVEFGGVAAANVSVADTNNKFTATNVEDVLLEIQNSLDNAIGAGGSVGTQITNAINALDSEKSGTSTSNHITVGVKQVDGIISSVTVSDSDIASATLLGATDDTKDNATAFGYIAKEAAARTAALEALDLTQVGGDGKVITTISQADGKVSASAIDLTASNVKATASSSSATAVAVDGATVEAQIASLAKSIKTVSTAAAAAHTKVEAKTDGHVRVSVAKSSDNTHDVVTITENDIASANALTAETSSRQSQDDRIEASIGLAADGSHVTTSGHYTNGATTVVGEIAALDTQLKAVSDTLGTGVTTAEGKTVTEQLQALSGTTGDGSDATSVNGAKAYAKKYADDLVNSLNATITSSSETTEHAITIVQTNGKIASITLGAFDCGTY